MPPARGSPPPPASDRITPAALLLRGPPALPPRPPNPLPSQHTTSATSDVVYESKAPPPGLLCGLTPRLSSGHPSTRPPPRCGVTLGFTPWPPQRAVPRCVLHCVASFYPRRPRCRTIPPRQSLPHPPVRHQQPTHRFLSDDTHRVTQGNAQGSNLSDKSKMWPPNTQSDARCLSIFFVRGGGFCGYLDFPPSQVCQPSGLLPVTTVPVPFRRAPHMPDGGLAGAPPGAGAGGPGPGVLPGHAWV